MDAIAQWALSNLATYGIPMLVLIAFIGSLGIPFPITMVIVAAGAFARAGLLDWRLALAACVVGATLADHSEYLLGRLARPWMERRFAKGTAWVRAEATLGRQGAWAILLTRFWLTPLAPAVNVIAGSRYPYWRFLFLDVLGQFVWAGLYGGLGYWFAEEWQELSHAAGLFSAASMAFFIMLAVVSLTRRRPASPQQKDVVL